MFRIPLAHNVGRGQIDSMTKPIRLGTARIALSMLLLAGATLTVAAGSISHIPFGATKDGRDVELYTLRNSHGMTAKVMTYGAVIYSLEVPDRHGKLANITANRVTLADYEARSGVFGSLIGRYANRIAGATFQLDGKTFTLPKNAPPNHIHGGQGFDKRVWTAGIVAGRDSAGLRLTYTSMDGEEGYPGTLKCEVLYELNDRNEWKMEYTATTDKPTVVNLCNHAYWNLAGACSGDVLGQSIQLWADRFLEVDETLIPTGKLLPVVGTPLDFLKPHTIGERIGEITEKRFGGGYDHCFVINRKEPGSLTHCATLSDPASGRTMEVWTTEPGVQIYSANMPSGTLTGPNNYPYPRHLGVCLETQHYPDSPNHPDFPTTTLRPGETYRSTTIHKFGIRSK